MTSLINLSKSKEAEMNLLMLWSCCLTAPSHYLNQCWLLISEVLWHSHESNFTVSTQTTLLYYEFESILLKLLPHLPVAKELSFDGISYIVTASRCWGEGNVAAGPGCYQYDTCADITHPGAVAFELFLHDQLRMWL